MITVETFTARIAVGFREGYSDVIHTMSEATAICSEYCNKVGLCVSVTETNFIYTNGSEPGCFVELINYPRFKSDTISIKLRAFDLAKIFLKEFSQQRISVICTDATYMFSS